MIREYNESDGERIVDIWAAASRVATPFLSDTFMAEERENIRKIWLLKAETWVFETGGIVAGFISLIGNEVGAIFVHPDFQGAGIGRTLMDHALSHRNELFLDVFAENEIGRGFYERYGFRYEHEHVHDPTGHMLIRLSYGNQQ